MLTLDEVKKINHVRLLLQSYMHDVGVAEGFPNGKFHEACKVAENALQNVLLIANHWLEVEIPNEEINIYLYAEERIKE